MTTKTLAATPLLGKLPVFEYGRRQARGYAPTLLPGEILVNVEPLDIRFPRKAPEVISQLQMLTGASSPDRIGDHGPALAAGVGKANSDLRDMRRYEAIFGRDSLIIANDVFPYYPKLLKTTLRSLAQYQGVRTRAASEEQPGRIPHEIRDKDDPIAIQYTYEHGIEWPFYGSTDATPLFISSLARYVESYGDHFLYETFFDRRGRQTTMDRVLHKAVGWLERQLDDNPEGLLESKPIGNVIKIMVWKDSFYDSYAHADGSFANTTDGLGSVELQSLAYDALTDASRLYRTTRSRDNQAASRLEKRAENIRRRLMEHFWVEDGRGGYFALATDRDTDGSLRPLKVRASNMGHLLNSKILLDGTPETEERVRSMIKTLFSDEMLNSSGIRTLSDRAYRFREGSYHNGSVWLWDTYYIAKGLDRHGYHRLADELKRRILRTVKLTRCYPEFVRGGKDRLPQISRNIVDIWDLNCNVANRLEQVPQEIQGWTVSAVASITLEQKDGNHRGHGDTPASALLFEKSILDRL
jgi:glycogen debranching enzyme